VWTLILLVYAFIASILPVQTLLQPRDFINSHQLFFAVGLVIFAMLWTHPPLDTGLAVTGAGRAAGDSSAPPFWPFLFITIACGAISGFHCLVSSGTTSKQVRSEPDAQFVGYGSMLSEGMLATVVILACTAGLAYGVSQQFPGAAPFEARYASWSAASGLGAKVGAFVDGAAFMIAGAFAWTGLPTEALVNLGLAVMGVFVVSFAATTLDTATRLQRYVIGELGHASRIKLLTNRYVATTIAVVTAAALALHDGQGKGGLALWPLFGIVNQLLAALGLLTATVWLYRRAKPVWFTLLPMLFMVVLTGWAMTIKLGDWYGWAAEAGLKGVVHGKSGAAWAMLAAIGTLIMVLEVWMLIESVLVWLRLRRLPPDQRLDKPSRTIEPAAQSAPVGVAD
jgi:carbon starvation protein